MDGEKTNEGLARAVEQLRLRVGELEAAEDRLRKSEEKYRSLVESTDDSIYLVDRDYKYIFMNREHLTRLGLMEDGFLGRSYGEFHSSADMAEFMRKVDRVFESGKSIKYEHLSSRDKRHFIRTLSPVKEADGKTTAVTIISKDITHLKKLEEELRASSLTDHLTGVFNRRGFVTLVEQQLRMAKRLNKGAFLLYADMDDLKLINDTLGHKEGDSALLETARMLKSTYRESDIVARIGGDEFVVFPVGTADEHVAVIVGRLKSNIEAFNTRKLHKYELSLSYGITYCDPRDGHSVEELMEQADAEMYKQKRLRRGQNPG